MIAFIYYCAVCRWCHNEENYHVNSGTAKVKWGDVGGEHLVPCVPTFLQSIVEDMPYGAVHRDCRLCCSVIELDVETLAKNWKQARWSETWPTDATKLIKNKYTYNDVEGGTSNIGAVSTMSFFPDAHAREIFRQNARFQKLNLLFDLHIWCHGCPRHYRGATFPKVANLIHHRSLRWNECVIPLQEGDA